MAGMQACQARPSALGNSGSETAKRALQACALLLGVAAGNLLLLVAHKVGASPHLQGPVQLCAVGPLGVGVKVALGICLAVPQVLPGAPHVPEAEGGALALDVALPAHALLSCSRATPRHVGSAQRSQDPQHAKNLSCTDAQKSYNASQGA